MSAAADSRRDRGEPCSHTSLDLDAAAVEKNLSKHLNMSDCIFYTFQNFFKPRVDNFLRVVTVGSTKYKIQRSGRGEGREASTSVDPGQPTSRHREENENATSDLLRA